MNSETTYMIVDKANNRIVMVRYDDNAPSLSVVTSDEVGAMQGKGDFDSVSTSAAQFCFGELGGSGVADKNASAAMSALDDHLKHGSDNAFEAYCMVSHSHSVPRMYQCNRKAMQEGLEYDFGSSAINGVSSVMAGQLNWADKLRNLDVATLGSA
jgi:hypothetical protein